MKLLNWVKYINIINVIILINLLKGQYTFYITIHIFKQFSFIHVSKYYQKYFSFNNIDASEFL